MLRGGFCTLIVCGGLSACVVGPDYSSPPPPETSLFRNAARVEARLASPAPALDRWWSGFGDRQLSDLVERALAQNLDLAQAEARVTQARAQARVVGAALVPAGQATAEAAAQRQSTLSPDGRVQSALPGYDRDQENYEVGAGASWELDLFGGLRRGSQAARAELQASEAARAGVRLTVAAETADAYVLLRSLQARLAVTRAQADLQRRQVALVDIRFNRGIAPRLQADQARGALSSVEAAVPVLSAGIEAQMNRLAVLVGVEPGSLHDELDAAAPIPAAPGIAAAGGPAALVRRRPDLIAAERRLAAADARIGVEIAEYYPKLSLSGLLGFESTDAGSLLSRAAFQPQAAAGLRWRLFDFGQIDAQVAAARGARAEALAAYRQSLLQATADVETALLTVVRREEQVRALRTGEAALARARASADAAWRAGQVSLIEVIDADARLLSTRDRTLQADTEAARAAIAAFRALGGGWTP